MSYPSAWKTSFITPIFKKSELYVENYRPIAIINKVAKIFYSLLYDKIAEYLRQNITQYRQNRF